MQLTRFEEENAEPCCFNWSVGEDGMADPSRSCKLGDPMHCDGHAGSRPTEVRDSSFNGDDATLLASCEKTASKGLTKSDCEAVQTNGEGIEVDDSEADVRSDSPDSGRGSSRHHRSRTSNMSVANSDSSLTDTPSSSSIRLSSCSNQCDSALALPPSASAVPTSDSAHSGVAEVKKAPTEVMSPRSYAVFKSELVHVPEMNLPWESMRKSSKCGCGVTFSYSVRKVSCSVIPVSQKENFRETINITRVPAEHILARLNAPCSAGSGYYNSENWYTS